MELVEHNVANNGCHGADLGESGTGKELIAPPVHAKVSGSYFPSWPSTAGRLPKPARASFLVMKRELSPGPSIVERERFEMVDGGTLF